MRNRLRFLAALCLSLALPLAATAQPAYPNRPISLVVGFAPGGVTDIIARLYANKLATRLGVAVTVDNRVGAGGTIATDYLARSAPNGYTLGVFLDNNTIAPALFAKLNSDPIKDFAPITLLALGGHIVVAHPSFAPNNLKELLDYARSKPGEPYATSGPGTAQHLGMELISLKAGVRLSHVPYKGGGQAINDLVAGQVKVGILGLAPVLPFIQSGQLKALAVTSENRVAALPNVATVSETLPGVSTLQWFGIVAPARTPPEIIQRLHREFTAISQDPEVVQKLNQIALEVRTSAQPQDLTRFMEQDLAKWPPLVKAAGIKPE